MIGWLRVVSVCIVDEGIRSEDAGTFGCLLQGEVGIINDAFIKVFVRGRRRSRSHHNRVPISHLPLARHVVVVL